MSRGTALAAGRLHTIIWGINPVDEFASNAPEAIEEVFILPSFGRKKRQRAVVKKLDSLGQKLIIMDAFSGLGIPLSAVHQGIAARVRNIWDTELHDLPGIWGNKTPLVVLCDEITDPGNLGGIIRASVAFGAHAVIISRRNCSEMNGTVIKASAGTIVHARIARVSNLVKAMEALKRMNLWIAGLASQGARDAWNINLTIPLALVLGAEGRGMRPLVLKHCDFSVRIPQHDSVESLNVVSACSVALYESMRQRATS